MTMKKEEIQALSIKATDLAEEMTRVNVQAKHLCGEQSVREENEANTAAIRQMLLQRGIVPEDLPPTEDVKKVERRLVSKKGKCYLIAK